MEAELNHTRKEEQTRKEILEEKAIPGVKMDNQQHKKEKKIRTRRKTGQKKARKAAYSLASPSAAAVRDAAANSQHFTRSTMLRTSLCPR